MDPRFRRTGMAIFLFSIFTLGSASSSEFSIGAFGDLSHPLYPKTLSSYYSMLQSGGIQGTVYPSGSAFSFMARIFYRRLTFNSKADNAWLWDWYYLVEGCGFGEADGHFITLEINARHRWPVNGTMLGFYVQGGFGYAWMWYDRIRILEGTKLDPKSLKIRADEDTPCTQFGLGLDSMVFGRIGLFTEAEMHFIFTNQYPSSYLAVRVGMKVHMGR